MTAAVQPPAKNSNSHVNWASGSAMLPSLIDMAAVAGYLGTTVRHVRRMVAERRMPYVKVGHLIRFDPADVVGPFVEALLGMRRRAREAKRFEESDAIRDELVGLGVEVKDGRGGTD